MLCRWGIYKIIWFYQLTLLPMTNAVNFCLRDSFQQPIYIINSVDQTNYLVLNFLRNCAKMSSPLLSEPMVLTVLWYFGE